MIFDALSKNEARASKPKTCYIGYVLAAALALASGLGMNGAIFNGRLLSFNTTCLRPFAPPADFNQNLNVETDDLTRSLKDRVSRCDLNEIVQQEPGVECNPKSVRLLALNFLINSIGCDILVRLKSRSAIIGPLRALASN